MEAWLDMAVRPEDVCVIMRGQSSVMLVLSSGPYQFEAKDDRDWMDQDARGWLACQGLTLVQGRARWAPTLVRLDSVSWLRSAPRPDDEAGPATSLFFRGGASCIVAVPIEEVLDAMDAR
jgi:hypothetical protein